MRLGLLGGTLNPVHCGHLDAARAARDGLHLDRVLLAPAHVPPHRGRGPWASPFHRFAMTALAVLDETGLAASDIELARPGPSFSIDTLRLLHQEGWSASQIFFITGADAFAEIATWRGYPDILDASHFVVVARPGYSHDSVRALAGHPGRVIDASDAVAQQAVMASGGTAIVLLNAPTAAASSTTVRQRIAAHESLAGLVPSRVERYIHQHRLYENFLRHLSCMAKTDSRRTIAGRLTVFPEAIREALRAAFDKKAQQVTLMDLRPAHAFTDAFVLCSGQSSRQVKAIAEAIEEELKKRGTRPSHVEGLDRAEWVLLDYFDFVVHVFTPDTRAFYGLERLWGSAEVLDISEADLA